MSINDYTFTFSRIIEALGLVFDTFFMSLNDLLYLYAPEWSIIQSLLDYINDIPVISEFFSLPLIVVLFGGGIVVYVIVTILNWILDLIN